MTPKSTDCPLLITVLDLFDDHRPQTLQRVVEELNVTEDAALTALERLESRDVLVRARGGTDTPVWKARPGANLQLLRGG
jgi:predicted ArsR family transcriptional regulator